MNSSGQPTSRWLSFSCCKFSGLPWPERVFVLAFVPAFLVPWHLCAAERQLDVTLTNKTGIVWYKATDSAAEVRVEPEFHLHSGNTLRTDTNSTAVVLVEHKDRLVRLWELTTLRVLPPESDSNPWLNLVRGAVYLFSREKSNEVRIRTPHGTGAPNGTEFVITVKSNETVLAMFDGTATFTNEWGATNLQSGEMCVARKGEPPIKMALAATNLVQWWLYYPGVLDVDELNFTPSEKEALSPSLEAYRKGDLAAALAAYPGFPTPSTPTTDHGRIYLAGLRLAAGQVDKAEALLNDVKTKSSLAEALSWVIAAVQHNVEQPPEVHTSASEWLGLSYYYQARHELGMALKAATNSVAVSPNFAFGWERVAELEFSFGHNRKARRALDNSLRLAPRNAQAHALDGFLLSADNRLSPARKAFQTAIELDPNHGNAWLGRGLIRIRTGDAMGGRMDLRMAAILEPNRSLLHSYLGKAFTDAGEFEKADLELQRARSLDTNDPTPSLYSALLKREENRINEAVDDLEESIERNDNRAVYRSRFKLDEDLAVRSVNLANIYLDAGMIDVSVREAARAVNADYANYSAHLFLASSYNALRDPRQISVRYETPWLSEYLMANLLAPVGAGTLSPSVSQQEYSKLFERDRPRFSSSTEYWSNGDLFQTATLYGVFGGTSYGIDTVYRSEDGDRPNSDFEQLTTSVRLKQQVTPQDTLLFQAIYYNAEAGDVRQYYYQTNAQFGQRLTETQLPVLLAGYHREWAPGSHTLFLGSHWQDTLKVTDPAYPVVSLYSTGQVIGVPIPPGPRAALDYRSEITGYSAELQQIWQRNSNTAIIGGRFQTGAFDTRSDLSASTPFRFSTNQPYLSTPSVTRDFVTDFQRANVYFYDYWQVFDPLLLSAGLSYDRVTGPENFQSPPVSPGDFSTDQLSPKGGFIWTPTRQTTVRAAYTRSLGGVSFDQSFQLEPTQVAGFNQAYRSLIPESVAGNIPMAPFETVAAAIEQTVGAGTYLGVQAECLRSQVTRSLGTEDFSGYTISGGMLMTNFAAASTPQKLDYCERNFVLTFNQLIDANWSFGARYRLSEAQLKTDLTAIPDSVYADARTDRRAVLNQLNLFALFNHESGFFGQVDSVWSHQSNHGYSAEELPGDDFWQFNAFVGWRFMRRRIELRLGVLNITDQNYRLNPLNLTSELPRERTLTTGFSFAF